MIDAVTCLSPPHVYRSISASALVVGYATSARLLSSDLSGASLDYLPASSVSYLAHSKDMESMPFWTLDSLSIRICLTLLAMSGQRTPCVTPGLPPPSAATLVNASSVSTPS